MIVSERIFIILKEKNMSQNEFAKRVGLSASTISDWKTKKTNPTTEKIMPICEVLEITPEQLLTGKNIDYVSKLEYKGQTIEQAELSEIDMQILKDFHGLKNEQRIRVLKYIEALKQLEELEEINMGI